MRQEVVNLNSIIIVGETNILACKVELGKGDFIKPLVTKLLQNLRDEAHRFAISFHRQKRKKSINDLKQDEIKENWEEFKESLSDDIVRILDKHNKNIMTL